MTANNTTSGEFGFYGQFSFGYFSVGAVHDSNKLDGLAISLGLQASVLAAGFVQYGVSYTNAGFNHGLTHATGLATPTSLSMLSLGVYIDDDGDATVTVGAGLTDILEVGVYNTGYKAYDVAADKAPPDFTGITVTVY